MLERIKLWWVARRRVEHIQVVTVSHDAYLFMTVMPDMPDADIARIREELKAFFGENRKIAIARAGDMQWSVVTFENPPDDTER